MIDNIEMDKWTKGQYVEVFGLQSQVGRVLNQQKGIVIKANDDTGRFEVCLGDEGKITSIKLECLRLVPGATAEEIQDAKDVAGPALRAGQESEGQPVQEITGSSETPFAAQRERSRSWSPPPEAVRAASVAGQQHSSAAVARGLSSEQAEALGAAAAEQSLAHAKQVANLQKRQQGAQQASVIKAPEASSVPASGGAATLKKKPGISFEDLKIGDSVQVKGLKGADKELNGEHFVVQDFQGWGGPRSRKYVLSTTRLVIDALGDPAEQKKVLTLPAKNIRLPGGMESIDSSADSKSRSRSRKKKKSTSKRSRSRRRKRRSRSPSSSSSPRPARDIDAALRSRGPAPALSKADRINKFRFIQQQR